ncbi:MAG TPA: hypothetical protein PKV98_10705 [Burkholderiaceae bacterium]|nr:hypothetical protein [Burkholderiaceae bacterium]
MQDAPAEPRLPREFVVNVQRIEVADQFGAAIEVGFGDRDRDTEGVTDPEFGVPPPDGHRWRHNRPPRLAAARVGPGAAAVQYRPQDRAFQRHLQHPVTLVRGAVDQLRDEGRGNIAVSAAIRPERDLAPALLQKPAPQTVRHAGLDRHPNVAAKNARADRGLGTHGRDIALDADPQKVPDAIADRGDKTHFSKILRGRI